MNIDTFQKETMLKYYVINALYNKGLQDATVKSNMSTGEQVTKTDASGFATLGPYYPGEKVKLEVSVDGFDPIEQELTIGEEPQKMIGMNPTVSQ